MLEHVADMQGTVDAGGWNDNREPGPRARRVRVIDVTFDPPFGPTRLQLVRLVSFLNVHPASDSSSYALSLALIGSAEAGNAEGQETGWAEALSIARLEGRWWRLRRARSLTCLLGIQCSFGTFVLAGGGN